MATGLRERKKLKTRLALVDAAVELFERKGFEATTVEEICERAEVSPSTFFRYFPAKEAVVFPDADERNAIAREVFVRLAHAEPIHVACRKSSLAMAELDAG